MDEDNSIKDQESPEQRDVSAAPNISRLIQPEQKSQRYAVTGLVTVNAIETRRNKEVKII
jgi:hypothetical protein